MLRPRHLTVFASILTLLFSMSCGTDEEAGRESGQGAGTESGQEAQKNSLAKHGTQNVDAESYKQREHWADAGDTLTIGVLGDSDGMLPLVGQSVSGSRINDLTTPLLTASDFKNGRILYHPALAKSWSWNEDKTELTYELRDDAYWDDNSGLLVDAEDVRFTYELMRDPDVKSPRQAFMERMVDEDPVQVLGKFRVRFRFKYAYNLQTMMAHAGFNVAPKHLLEHAERKSLLSHEIHKKRGVGHGPFRFLSWTPKQEVVIVRNKKCRTYPVPYLRRIRFKVIPEYQTRLTELRKGGIDMMDAIQEKDIEDAQKWGNVKLYERGYRFLDYVAWNAKNPLFADREVRRALTMAIDIQRIVKNILSFGGKTYGQAAYSTFTPELKDFVVEDLELLPHSAQQALKTLHKLGWKDRDGDGVLDKDGKAFEFVMLTNTGNPRRQDACVLIQEDLKKIGIKCNLEQREGVTFFDLLSKKDFDAALAGWSAGLFPDPSDVWGSASETQKRVFNFTSYSNPKVDVLIDRELKTADAKLEAKT